MLSTSSTINIHSCSIYRELRDQLIGRRCGNGIVFTWGICNDGRLGIENQENVKGQNDDELIAVKPTIVQFPTPSIIIVKVACGLTYSLALSSSESGYVYSWGYVIDIK